ncbi:uncharacterized protein C2845_PM01G49370 [Panicum miliaceum]|uniref:Uncharacterized protein n=1 Tax=Panicum miliaceum TaxID=4540 RepID=A0A3L6TV57_PANMI|nr:uncharacterized protein C2845_PM01G49370 [Panicum miliaceum]
MGHHQVLYHPFTREEQVEATELEKKAMEERKGIIGSTMDALVGSGVGLVGTSIVGGVGHRHCGKWAWQIHGPNRDRELEHVSEAAQQQQRGVS